MTAVRATILVLCTSVSVCADPIDDYVLRQMDQLHLPGLALAVVRDGRVERIRTYGKANVERDAPVTRETVFEIGSVTKQFTAAAVMMLVEDGRLRLDESIATYLPEVPARWRAITVRHLLTHTSGLQEYLSVPGLADQAHALGHREMTRLFASRIAQEFAPGETWAYSNTGYLLLGDIIDRVSGRSYWEFLRARIFDRAGMRATRSSEPRAVIPRRAAGYEWKNGVLEGRPALTENAYGAGSIASTIDDMARWAIALQRHRLLSTASRDLIWTPVTTSSGLAPFAYGFGWVIDHERGHRAVFHSGGTPGFSSALRYYPDERLSVIVLANLGDRIIEQMPLEIAGMILPRLARRSAPDLDNRRTERLAGVLRGYIAGTPDARAFTPAMRLFLSTATARGFGEWFASHGPLTSLRYASTEHAGDISVLRYRAVIGGADLWVSFTLTPEGTIARIYWW